MGVDCKAFINSAQPEDVLKVCAILHNVKKKIKIHDTGNPIVDLEPSLKFKLGFGKPDEQGYMTDLSSRLQVEIDINKDFSHSFALYLNSNSKGQLQYYARANVKNIALGIKLVQIFGGEFIPSDSNDNVLFENKNPLFKPEWTDNESDVKHFAKNQFFADLKSITKEDILEAEKHSAYKLDDDNRHILDFYPHQAEFIYNKLDKDLDPKTEAKRKPKI
jgi:hypothetical protein